LSARQRRSFPAPPAGGAFVSGVRMTPRWFRLSTLALALAAGLAGCGAGDGPGSAPVVLAAFACGERASPIHAIQGAGPRSPFEGVVVDTEGVVTARLSGLGGFFLQSADATADADPATSEGLFVRTAEPRRDLKAGMHVRVRGTVTEEAGADGGSGFTVIAPLNQLAVCAESVALPAASAVAEPPPEWERFEGMRVLLPGPVTVTGNFELLRFGRAEISLAGRLFHPTERFSPGPQARTLAEANARARVLVDDNLEVEDPRRVWWLGGPVGPARPWRVGTAIDGLAGVLDERGGRHRLQLTAEPTAVRQAPRPTAPPAVGGTHRVAAFNLLNWFNGDGRGGGFPTPRGAQDAAAAARQRDKLVAAIVAMQPDVAALMEVENDGHDPDSAIAQLVAALNAALGAAGDYRLVDPGVVRLGGDQIKVGLIYRSGRVREAGRAAYIEGGPFSDYNRVPLAQAFEPVDGGVRFVVVANHWKSKGGCDEAQPADRDRGDGQGCYNPRRVDAARVIADWLATDPTGSGGAGALLVGDLNAYGQEDPLRLLRQRGWIDALQRFAGETAYSFVFGGASGRLDHALASASLASRVVGAAEWHVNADELTVFDYTSERKGERRRALYRPDPFRSSDHDPLVVGLDLVATTGAP
jgi:predicted extracellular nuclease